VWVLVGDYLNGYFSGPRAPSAAAAASAALPACVAWVAWVAISRTPILPRSSRARAIRAQSSWHL